MCRYFSHDVGAHYHRKIRRLRGVHGWAGYGLYWAILELLREEDEDGYTLPLDYNALKAAFGVPAKKIKSIVEGFGLFVIDEEREVFYSPGLIERMQLMRHKYQPPTPADDPPKADEDERKAELSRKRAEAGSKGGKIGGKVYRPSQANSPTEDVEESKTKANAKQKESKTALRGGNIGGKREKEENIFSKQSSSPQSVSVSERVGVGAGAEPRDAGRARESEAEAEASGTARQARQHDEAAMLSPGDYLDAEGKDPMAWLRESVADDGLDEYYRKMAEQRPPVGFAPSPWGNGSYGSGQALVCALKETYDQMRAENASWSDCKAITAEMMADALESVTHYGSSAAVGEVMKRATNLPFLQGKRNLQRLAWLLKLKTLSAIEEGAYTDSPTPPKPRGGAIAYPTPMRVNAAFEDIPPPPDY